MKMLAFCKNNNSKIDKPLTHLVKEGRQKKTRNTSKKITNDTGKFLNIKRDYFTQLHTNKMEDLSKLDYFLRKYNLSPLVLLYVESINRQISIEEREKVTKKLTIKTRSK